MRKMEVSIGKKSVRIYGGKLIIHRDIKGQHNTMSEECWCDPLVIDPGSTITTGQIKEESDKRDLKQ
jgi:hypothetical protein